MTALSVPARPQNGRFPSRRLGIFDYSLEPDFI